MHCIDDEQGASHLCITELLSAPHVTPLHPATFLTYMDDHNYTFVLVYPSLSSFNLDIPITAFSSCAVSLFIWFMFGVCARLGIQIDRKLFQSIHAISNFTIEALSRLPDAGTRATE